MMRTAPNMKDKKAHRIEPQRNWNAECSQILPSYSKRSYTESVWLYSQRRERQLVCPSGKLLRKHIKRLIRLHIHERAWRHGFHWQHWGGLYGKWGVPDTHPLAIDLTFQPCLLYYTTTSSCGNTFTWKQKKNKQTKKLHTRHYGSSCLHSMPVD